MDEIAPAALELFGNPALRYPDGHRVSGGAGQRHRIALLALLALSAGRKGASRDWLVGYLWPESDADRARTLLNSSVYVLRKALGDAALLTEGEVLRLDPERIRVDVWRFEEAIARADAATAVETQTAPLLEGFFLPNATEFDHYIGVHRDRLGKALDGALEALAEDAEARGDVNQAVRRWKERAARDPYDTRVALRVAAALDAGGNRAAALRFAEQHRQILLEVYGAESTPDLNELVHRWEATAQAVWPPTARREDASEPGSPRPAPAWSRSLANGEQTVAWGGETAESAVRVHGRPRALLAGAVIALLLVLGTWVGLRGGGDVPEPARRPLLAVLPLAARSAAEGDAALADGLTEQLIARLSEGGLRVIASTSVFPFRGRAIDVRAVADSLGAAHVLEGDVQRSGERLRVRLHLVDVADGSTAWSRTYDLPMGDIFGVQDSIAYAVARELGHGSPSAIIPASPPTSSIAAYELYLRGNDPTLLRSDSAARRGREYFGRAIALDSGYAAAWAGWARMVLRGGADSTRRLDRDLEVAEAAARRAVALDPGLAEARATLGLAEMVRFDFGSAEEELGRALEIDPGKAATHQWLVTLYLWTRRPSLALEHARRSLELDPLSPAAHAEYARALIAEDRCGDALDRLRPLTELRPPLLRVAPLVAGCLAAEGRWREAIDVVQPFAEHDIVFRGQLGLLLAASGNGADALKIGRDLEAAWMRGEEAAFGVALIHAGLGDVDDAVTWLDRGLEDGSLSGGPGHASLILLSDPLLSELRGSPPFAAWLTRLAQPTPSDTDAPPCGRGGCSTPSVAAPRG